MPFTENIHHSQLFTRLTIISQTYFHYFSLALRMSVKAFDSDPTQLECTAKIQQLELKITQITQEVAALKSGACSSPGTEKHTLIKPVTSKSIALNGPGKGTSQEPYKIANIQDLQKLRNIWQYAWGKYFIVTQNIDLSSIANFAPLPTFRGILDGNNKKIMHLKIDTTQMGSQTAYTGLFSLIAGTGLVKDLRLENVLVKGAENVGGLAGVLSGRIDNSYVTGQVIGTQKYYSKGGLVGRIESGSRITDSYATTKVSGLYHVGGLVGKSYLGSTIQRSYATGTVSGIGSTSSAGNGIGGLVGAHYGMIQSSYATGNVSGRDYIGGLVGLSGVGHLVKINNSYATGSVSGRGLTGGLVGENGGTITKCYATGQVSGGVRMGGLVGDNTGIIDNSHVTGQVSGTDGLVGGLVGRSGSDSRITNSYATAKVSGKSSVGGLVGFLYRGTIQSSYATGTVSGNTPNTGSSIGGLVGDLSGMIQRSYATGSVLGQSYLGGFVGFSSSGHHIEINNSYATGNVSGTSLIGGLVGDNRGTITKCYAIGRVSGDNRVGGLVGENTGKIANSYGKQQLGTTNRLGAKTDTQLKTPSTFTGWDTRLWKLTPNQHPKLKSLN